MTVLPPKVIGLATPEFAAELLTDLYVRLRRDLQRWALLTQQTPQPRMGYVGQHLVSVVTGHPGGRSGARGDDLKLPDGSAGEIKCCYRVDQLGKCRRCGTAVAAIERVCPNVACGSDQLERKDDSKWLLSPKSEQELRELFGPTKYYFVLFEFEDMERAEDIDVCIYEVDPRSLGFSLGMIDYFFNIRANSVSKAPFNLWPHSPKFYMMKPKLIYWSVIKPDDSIVTNIFPGRDEPLINGMDGLASYAGADTFTEAAIDSVARARNVDFAGVDLSGSAIQRRRAKLHKLQEERERQAWSDEQLADDFARAVYASRLTTATDWTREFAPTL